VVFASKRSAGKATKGTNGAVSHLERPETDTLQALTMRVLDNGQTLEGKPISVKLVPTFSKTDRPCRSFLAGICRKGDACKYVGYHLLHPMVETSTN